MSRSHSHEQLNCYQTGSLNRFSSSHEEIPNIRKNGTFSSQENVRGEIAFGTKIYIDRSRTKTKNNVIDGRRCRSAMALSEQDAFIHKKVPFSSSLNKLTQSPSSSVSSLATSVSSKRADYSHVGSKVRKYIKEMKEKDKNNSGIKSVINLPAPDGSLLNLYSTAAASSDNCESEEDIFALVENMEQLGDSKEAVEHLFQFLLQERKSRLNSDKTLGTLQYEYEDLLSRYAEIETFVDRLRFRQEGSSDPRKLGLHKVCSPLATQSLQDLTLHSSPLYTNFQTRGNDSSNYTKHFPTNVDNDGMADQSERVINLTVPILIKNTVAVLQKLQEFLILEESGTLNQTEGKQILNNIEKEYLQLLHTVPSLSGSFQQSECNLKSHDLPNELFSMEVPVDTDRNSLSINIDTSQDDPLINMPNFLSETMAESISATGLIDLPYEVIAFSCDNNDLESCGTLKENRVNNTSVTAMDLDETCCMQFKEQEIIYATVSTVVEIDKLFCPNVEPLLLGTLNQTEINMIDEADNTIKIDKNSAAEYTDFAFSQNLKTLPVGVQSLTGQKQDINHEIIGIRDCDKICRQVSFDNCSNNDCRKPVHRGNNNDLQGLSLNLNSAYPNMNMDRKLLERASKHITCDQSSDCLSGGDHQDCSLDLQSTEHFHTNLSTNKLETIPSDIQTHFMSLKENIHDLHTEIASINRLMKKTMQRHRKKSFRFLEETERAVDAECIQSNTNAENSSKESLEGRDSRKSCDRDSKPKRYSKLKHHRRTTAVHEMLPVMSSSVLPVSTFVGQYCNQVPVGCQNTRLSGSNSSTTLIGSGFPFSFNALNSGISTNFMSHADESQNSDLNCNSNCTMPGGLNQQEHFVDKKKLECVTKSYKNDLLDAWLDDTTSLATNLHCLSDRILGNIKSKI